jgi:thiosulfate dehydrogenase [quinone] large subunit
MVDIAKNSTVRDTTRPNAAQTAPMPDVAEHQPAAVGHAAPLSRVVEGRGSEPAPMTTTAADSRSATAARYLLAGIRIALGWVFLWAFLDKTFGLGFATTSEKAWINGGSPTKGFLGSAKGPFSDFYHSIAGTGLANVLFMAGLLAIGVALILGIGMRLAAAGGALLTVMMWTAVLPPSSNPFMDDHLIYAAVLIVLALLGAGNTLGLGRQWAATPLVQRFSWLK